MDEKGARVSGHLVTPRAVYVPLAGDGFCCKKPRAELESRPLSPCPELSH